MRWRSWWWSQNAGTGGGGGLNEVEDDPAPALGGNLDVNQREIQFTEDPGSGTDYLGFDAPDSIVKTTVFKIDHTQVFMDFTTNNPYSVVEEIDHIIADASAGNLVINLHSAGTQRFRPLKVTRIDSTANSVTINAFGADNILNLSSITVNGQWSTRSLLNDESATWYLV